MSTLEKTICMLNDLPEKQIEIVYSYVAFLKTQSEKEKSTKSVDDIFTVDVTLTYPSGVVYTDTLVITIS